MRKDYISQRDASLGSSGATSVSSPAGDLALEPSHGGVLRGGVGGQGVGPGPSLLLQVVLPELRQ